MSKNEFKGTRPDTLYVVTYDDCWRIFSSEGQAMRWYALQVNEGMKPAVYQYVNPITIAKVDK